MDLPGKLDRLPLSAIKAKRFVRRRRTIDVSYLNP